MYVCNFIPGPLYLDFGEQPVFSLCFDHVWLLTMCTLCPISRALYVHVFFVLAVRPWLKAPDFSKPVMNCKFSFIHVLKTALVDNSRLDFRRPCHVFGFLLKGCHRTNWFRHTLLLPLCCLHTCSRHQARIVGVCNISQQTPWILCLSEYFFFY